jgi:putative acetyltransferase
MSPPMDWNLRRARADDVAPIARFYRRVAEAEWDFLPPHTPAEDLQHFQRLFERGPIWIAEADGALLGFCAAPPEWIDQLIVDHPWHGRGIGRALLAAALEGRERVRLWTFQRNARTRRFYKLQGFTEILETDGSDNEEKEPDVLLEWRRSEGR